MHNTVLILRVHLAIKSKIMKALTLVFLYFFLVGKLYSQSTEKYFYNALLELNKNTNDSINYYLLKIKSSRYGDIEKINVLFFNNNSILSKELKIKSFMYSLKDVISDSTILKIDQDEKKWIICPIIIKKLKFIKNPNTELVFSVQDINRIFMLMKETYNSKKIKYKLVTPSIIFSEEIYH